MTAVEVFVDDTGSPRLVGQAHFTRARSRISTTFLYDPAYLADGGMNLDPALLLVSGAQHQAGLTRAFADSAPDRWGRNLIEKAERTRAREEGRALRRLDDLDFLLGVSDDTRQGALRPSRSRSTSIMGGDVLPEEVEGVLALADECSLTPEAARERISHIAAHLSGWRGRARENQISEREIAMMAESIDPRLEAVAQAGWGST